MGQGHQCCSKQKVKRGLWSPEEDEKLVGHIRRHGHGCWSSVPRLAGLQRCGKSCRLRWINYLRPDVKRGSFTEQEERTIIEVHRILGNRWAQIAKHLPGRTDNEVKNFWNSCIKKKLLSQGLDPNTHNLLISSSSSDANATTSTNTKLPPNPINSTFTLHHSTSTSTSASTANHMHMHMHDDHYSSSDDPLFSSLLNITSHLHNIQQPQHHYHTHAHTHELAMEDAEYLNYDIPLTQGDFPADFDHFILDSAFISMPPPPLPLPLDHAPLPNSNWHPY